MSTTKISQLPSDSNPSTTDYVPALDTETTSTRKITLANILSLFFNNIPSSVVTNASLKTGAGEPGGAWDTWTPTLTNLTLGNGTLTAKYKKIGKTIHFKFILTLGSTSSVGTNPYFTLPETAASDYVGAATPEYANIGFAKFLDSGTSNFSGFTNLRTTTTAAPQLANASSTYLQVAVPSATAPFTWGNGDALFSVGTYEAA